jgi:hypothetical protein
MAKRRVYNGLIEWLKQTWWGMPDSAELMPLIKFFPSGNSIEFKNTDRTR